MNLTWNFTWILAINEFLILTSTFLIELNLLTDYAVFGLVVLDVDWIVDITVFDTDLIFELAVVTDWLTGMAVIIVIDRLVGLDVVSVVL